MSDIRYKACFACKVAVPIFPDNFHNKKLERWFNLYHTGHITQIVTIKELTPKNAWEIINEKPKP